MAYERHLDEARPALRRRLKRLALTGSLLMTVMAGAVPAGATALATPTWKGTAAPVPAGAAVNPNVVIESVACPTASSCVAAGRYLDAGGVAQGLLLNRKGSKWTATEAPAPVGATDINLIAAGCSNAGDCVAVGSYYDADLAVYEPLLIAQSGGSWSQQPISGYTSELETVGCSPKTGCVIGDQGDDVVADVAGTWTASAIAAPVPGGHASTWAISSIACAKVCVAAGTEYVGGSFGDYGAVVAQGTGTSWTSQLVPLPANAEPYSGTVQNASLDAVACAKTGQCAAAGTYETTSFAQEAMLLWKSGSKWTATESVLPATAAGQPSATLTTVTCQNATECVALGNYTDISNDAQDFIDNGAGSTWSTVEAPIPSAGAGDGGVNEVACTTSTTCAAAGAFTVAKGGYVGGLLLEGSGTTWAATAAARSPKAGIDDIVTPSVACAGPRTCIAVGNYPTKKGFFGLIETLTGA